jgi:hypothetical protein
MRKDLWSSAKSIKKEVEPLWTGDFEVYFPTSSEEDDGPECFISDLLGDAMANTPSIQETLLKLFGTYRLRLQGHSVRVQDGKAALFDGNSGDFLRYWSLPED